MRLYDPIRTIPGVPRMDALAAALRSLEGTDLSRTPVGISVLDFVRAALAPHLPPGTKFKIRRRGKVDHKGVMYGQCIDFMVHFDGHWWVVIRGAKPIGVPTPATCPDLVGAVMFRDLAEYAKTIIERNWRCFTTTQRLFLHLVFDGSESRMISTILGVGETRICHMRNQVAEKISGMLKAA